VVRDLAKSYGELRAVDGISLDVSPGEFVTFLGPSGSGKTTTLRMIAGFIEPDHGQIEVDGRSLVGVPPYRRDIGMVFQNYALFPHMTAGQNIAFPLEMQGLKKPEVRRRTDEALALVRLASLGYRYPRQLSGGQQQRIALARAIVFRPRLLLMDEPLGALDKKLREALQLEITHVSRQVGVTVVYVTHDQEEALVMSDRIAIFNQGRIEQLGTGEDLYDRPASLFVADFIGESNIFRGRLEIQGDLAWVVRGPFRWRVSTEAVQRVGIPAGAAAAVVVRPERLLVEAAVPPTAMTESPGISNASAAVLKEIIYLGSSRKYVLTLGDGTVATVRRQADQAGPELRTGQEVVVGWRVADGVVVADESAEALALDESGDVTAPAQPIEPPSTATVAASDVPGLSHRE
jgi:putative spermidine/putrescine transport system ATP-binding protein